VTIESIQHWLSSNAAVRSALIVFATAAIAYLSLFLTRRIVLRGLAAIVRRTSSSWDDILMHRGVFEKLAWFAPALVVYYATAAFAHDWEPLILRLVDAYIILVVVVTIGAFLEAVIDIYSASKLARDVPIKGYIQITRLILYLSSSIVIISIVFHRSPWVFLSGIGAATAILLLIFKDTILSFVASIQIASNDLLRLGDNIEMPKYDADGEVVDIALHTIKVQNGDLTITTIPTFKMVEEPFKNWRGIQQAGARRIKRALLIDQSSIAFLDKEAIARMSKIHLLSGYIAQKTTELDRYNRESQIDASMSPVNGRRMTNIGTLRAYLLEYLRTHPQVRKDMPMVVRQLAPGPNGLPIEIYGFVSETAWASYEGIQADIFDHVLAALPEFGLRVFQNPTGFDLAARSRAEAAVLDDG
jgi:miniconductance mechanosensitive channel